MLICKRDRGASMTPCLNNGEIKCNSVYLDSGSGRERLSEADHAHVVCVLFQAACTLVAAVQTGQAALLIPHPATEVAACLGLTARQLGILLQRRE